MRQRDIHINKKEAKLKQIAPYSLDVFAGLIIDTLVYNKLVRNNEKISQKHLQTVTYFTKPATDFYI